ncbi:MAG TPA: MBG domain-containing protein [Planctomycetota bacterium]|jgi:hypothetical protein
MTISMVGNRQGRCPCATLAAFIYLALLQFACASDAISTSVPPVIQGYATNLAIDGNGNRYVTGYFSGTVDFNPATGEDSKTSAGGNDAFITRYNADGTYVWTRTFGGASNDAGYAIAVAGTTVYVTGGFDSANAGLGGSGTLSTTGSTDSFILALNASDGSQIWQQKFGGTGSDNARAIALSDGKVLIAGYFGSPDAGVNGTGSLAQAGGWDAFVLALNAADGTEAWKLGFGGTQYDTALAIAASSGVVYVTGEFSATANIYGIGSGSMTSTGGANTYIWAMNISDGSKIWMKQFGGNNGNDVGRGIAVSGSNLYVAGSFESTSVGMDGSGPLTKLGNASAYILALNAADGTEQWKQKFGGSNGWDKGMGVAVAGSSLFVMGDLESSNAGVGALGALGTSGGIDAFTLALDASNGAEIWKQKFGGGGNDNCSRIAAYGSTVWVSGYFVSSNAGVGGTGPASASGFNGFLLPLDSSSGKGLQSISFPALTAIAVGNPDVDPGATASSGLAVSYSSSNPAVATIVSGKIHAVGDGATTITALQSGNANYSAAADVARVLTVGTGLVARWMFDEGSGTTAADCSGNGNNGTLQNGTTWSTGMLGGAVSFDGSNDLITIPDNLIRNYNVITIAMWFKTTGCGALIGHQNDVYPTNCSTYIPVIYVGSDGKLRAELSVNAVTPIVSTVTVNNGSWHHVALTGNVNTQTLYLDGQPVGTLSGTIDHANMSKNQIGMGRAGGWWPGLGSSWAPFQGSIDDARIYSRVLSQAEIQALYAIAPPQAGDDSYSPSINTELTVPAPGVLSNDTAPSGRPLTAIKQTDPTHGTLSLAADGSFTYTPSAGYEGADSFTYLTNDGLNDSNIATVKLLVGGLLAHWTFDEGSGTTVVDSSGNGHDGTLMNGTARTTGIIGSGALYFDGVDDYVNIGMANQPLPWTFAFWLKRHPVTRDSARLMHGTPYSLKVEQYSNTKKIGYGQDSVGNYAFNYVAPVDSWVHAAFVTTASGTSLYINGALVDSRTETIALPLTSISHAPEPIKGALDDVRAYNRALSQAEIKALIPQFPPQAADDHYNTNKGETLSVTAPGVLANDFDFNGDSFTAVKKTDPANGSLTFNSDGSFTYIPNPGFEGTDTFTYVGNDGADSSPATVRVSVGRAPLPAGYIKRMLHLGASETDRITGYPTSGQGVLWDFFTYAGAGLEHIQQPSPGQAVDMRLAVNGSTSNTVMVWTDLTDADNDGAWGENCGDNYSTYFAIYIWAPSDRSTKIVSNSDDDVRTWLDGNQTPLLSTTGSSLSSATFTLTAGYHSFIFKLHEASGNDFFSVKFCNPDDSDMTDLQYTLYDPIPPRVAGVLPANGATEAAVWNDFVVTFSEPMDLSVNPATVAIISGGAASGSWSWADNTTLMWMPAAPLAAATTYTFTIDASKAKDRSGNTLSGGSIFSFTTQTALSTPSLSAISPGRSKSGTLHASLTGAGFIEGGVQHPADAIPFQGHYYSYKNQMTDWYSACSLAAAQGGHLVTLANAQEDNFVWHFGGMTNNWIGLTDIGHYRTFTWITGETDSYQNWSSGEPNDWGGEDYGVYWWGFNWNDVGTSSDAQRPYVMEFDAKYPPAVKLARAGQSDILATNVHYTDDTSLEFDLNVTGAVDGNWDVVLTNPDGATATLSAGFTIDSTPPHVVGVSPAPSEADIYPPASILVDADEALDPASVSAVTCHLTRAGADGLFGTADDVTITPADVMLDTPTRIKLDLTGLTLPSDSYRMTIGCYDIVGNALDGEYTGTWPTGNGSAGGDFVSTFTIASQLSVASLSPAPNSAQLSPAAVVATCNRDLDAATVNASSFLLVGRGPDGQFDTPDDVPITAASVTVEGTRQAKFDLTGITLPGDLYRVTLVSGGIKDTDGRALDGEFSGSFPSGNSLAGGNFVATFSVGKQDQTIDFPTISAKSYGNSPFDLQAAASSLLPVSYVIDFGPAIVNGSQLTITGVGTVAVRANQAGNGYWNAAPDVTRSFIVSKGTATVTLSDLTRVYDGAPASIGIATNPSGMAVDVSYNGLPTAPTEPGWYFVIAAVNDANWQGTGSGMLLIEKISASVTIGNLVQAYDGTPKSVSATTSPMGLVVTITYDGFSTPPTDAGSYVAAAVVDAAHHQGSSYRVLTILPAPLTITADAKSKVYGDDDPALTRQITSGSLFGTDQFTGDLSCMAGENVGTYAIQQGTLSAGANYSLTYVSANLTISSKALTVTADAKSKVYGDADPALTYQITSGALVRDEVLTGSLVRVVGENAGFYAIQQGTLAATGNYSLAFAGSTLTIAKADQTISFAAVPKKTEDDPDFSGGASATSSLPISYASSDENVATIANGKIHIVGVGSCTITASQPGDANWNPAPTVQQVLSVLAGVTPKITSPLTAQATRESAFSYQCAASGSTPMTFAVSNLPAGLSFSGDTISGAPAVAGTAMVSITASNRFGLDSQTLHLTIARPAGAADSPPTLSSPPVADADIAVTGSTLNFTATANDADGDLLTYTWDFGDGSSGAGNSAGHVYTTAGVYTVVLTVSDGTTSTTQQMDVVVAEAAVPPGTDNGGDPTWTEGTSNAFVVTKGSVKFAFTDGAKDTLQFSGSIPVNKFFKPLDRKVTVVIGDFRKEFTLNAKGQGTSGRSSFKLSGKMKKGIFKATPAKFTLSIKGETLLSALKDFGFADKTTAKTGEQVNMSAIIMVDTLGYQTEKAVFYKARAGKSGSAK